MLVREAMNALFTGASAEHMRDLFNEDLIQHDPEVATGLAPVLERSPAMKAAGIEHQIHRIFEDGDLVATHSTVAVHQADGRSETVALEVWRIENGKVAEWWANRQPVVEATASGRSQVDGATDVTDRDLTAKNKEFMARFVNDVILKQAPQNLTMYISSEQYDQHNPLIKDGIEGIVEALELYDTSNVTIHKTLGEGNFMMLMSEGELQGVNHAYFDLFRIEGGLIVEHWDVVAPLPAAMAHDNGMF